MFTSQLVVVEDKKLDNTLHILFDKRCTYYNSSYQYFTISAPRSALRLNGQPCTQQQTILTKCLGYIDNDSKFYKLKNSQNIYVSPLFAKTFGVVDGETVFCKHISSPLTLEIVVLIPKNKSALKAIHDEKEFKKAFIASNPVVNRDVVVQTIQENNIYEYYVTDCKPSLRGLVTDDTAIVVLKDTSLFPIDFRPPKSVNEDVGKILFTSSFITIKSIEDESTEITLDVEYTFSSAPFEYVSKIHGCDPHAIGIVSMKTLRKLRCFSGTWMNVLYNGKRRCIGLYCISQDFDEDLDMFGIRDNVIYVSSHLAFNMGINTQPKVISSREVYKITVDLSHVSDSPPPIAESVIIVPVKSPNHFSTTGKQQSVKELDFKKYFSKPHVICEGDIFAVPECIDSIGEGFDELDAIEAQVAEKFDPVHEHSFYKVVKITNPSGTKLLGCRVDPIKTRLATEGILNAFLPPMQDTDNTKVTINVDILESFKKLKNFIMSILSYHSNNSKIKYSAPLSVLLYGPKGSGAPYCVAEIAKRFGLHLVEINSYQLLGEGEVQTEENIRNVFQMARECVPCIVHLTHIEALASEDAAIPSHMKASKIRLVYTLKELLSSPSKVKIDGNRKMSPILIASTEQIDTMSISFRSIFLEKIKFEKQCTQSERTEIIKHMLSKIPHSKEISPLYLSKQLTGSSLIDVQHLVSNAQANAIIRISSELEKGNTTIDDICECGSIVSLDDFEKALQVFRKSTASVIGAPQVPNVTWADIGGLEEAKKEVLDCIQLPLQLPHLFTSGLKQRSGILLYGPPGTGKTLLAKAVATECSLNFLSVKGPELINMYIGESERNIREVFQKAREASPCVIFFDELDSLAPNRGVSGDSAGVMDRVVSQLLAELSGIQHGKQQQQVFVIGATNRPDLIDPALLIPGRFDRLVYLSVSTDKENQLKIMKALTRKFNLAKDVSLKAIVEKAPMEFTGADFYALCSDALMSAILRKAEQLENDLKKENATNKTSKTMETYLTELGDVEILVNQDDFLNALKNITPSVSKSELQRYQMIQQKFKARK